MYLIDRLIDWLNSLNVNEWHIFPLFQAMLPDKNAVLAFMRSMDEHLFVLWKLIMLKKRVLFVAGPPVETLCMSGKFFILSSPPIFFWHYSMNVSFAFTLFFTFFYHPIVVLLCSLLDSTETNREGSLHKSTTLFSVDLHDMDAIKLAETYIACAYWHSNSISNSFNFSLRNRSVVSVISREIRDNLLWRGIEKLLSSLKLSTFVFFPIL